MVIEQGVVEERTNSGIWVLTSAKSACSSCSAKAGCGSNLLARFVGSKNAVHVTVDREIHLQKGDVVEIGVAEHAVVVASLLSYLVPLVGLVVGALICASGGDLTSILGAIFGMFAGVFAARFLHRYYFASLDFEPKFVAKLSAMIASDKIAV